jgi:hypothetical protein
MTLILYLIRIYNYIINCFSFSSNTVLLKHKNSEDYEDYEDCEDLSNNYVSSNKDQEYDQYEKYDEYYNLVTHSVTKIQEPSKKINYNKKKLRVKISDYIHEYPTYSCGNCLANIITPTHMYNGEAFCSINCRKHKMNYDMNKHNNLCS